MKKETKKAIREIYEHAKLHPLYKECMLNKEFLAIWRDNGNDYIEYLFIGEAPGKKEAKEGKPFIGKSGQLLQKIIDENNLKQWAITNAIPIKPTDEEGKIRKPYLTEINFFKKHIMKLIHAVNPKYIILLGKTASEILEQPWKPLQWQQNKAILYHPAYYLRGNRNIKTDFEKIKIRIKKVFKAFALGEKK